MKLRNSTDWSDAFVRRMLSWVCRQLGYSVRRIRDVQVRNRTDVAYSGHAYGTRRIVCSIGPESKYPLNPDERAGMGGLALQDRIEALVSITAHEVCHLSQYHSGRDRGLNASRKIEFDARWHELQVVRAFREQRETLLAQWNEPEAERPPRPVKTAQEKRAGKAVAALERWQRKLKLAQTKVKAYRRKVAYYERVAAKKAPMETA